MSRDDPESSLAEQLQQQVNTLKWTMKQLRPNLQRANLSQLEEDTMKLRMVLDTLLDLLVPLREGIKMTKDLPEKLRRTNRSRKNRDRSERSDVSHERRHERRISRERNSHERRSSRDKRSSDDGHTLRNRGSPRRDSPKRDHKKTLKRRRSASPSIAPSLMSSSRKCRTPSPAAGLRRNPIKFNEGKSLVIPLKKQTIVKSRDLTLPKEVVAPAKKEVPQIPLVPSFSDSTLKKTQKVAEDSSKAIALGATNETQEQSQEEDPKTPPRTPTEENRRDVDVDQANVPTNVIAKKRSRSGSRSPVITHPASPTGEHYSRSPDRRKRKSRA